MLIFGETKMIKKIAVSIFVPAHNESKTIAAVLRKISAVLILRKISGEIIFIDDGSTDSTWSQAKNISDKHRQIRTFRHKKKLGLTKSFAEAFKKSRGEVIIFLPADLQSDPERDIPILLKKIREGYDVVAGYRLNRPTHDVFDSLTYNLILRLSFNLSLHDMNWVKAFRREKVKNMKLRSDWHRFLIPLLSWKNARITEVPVRYFPRIHGQSKFGFKRIPRTLFDLVAIKILMILGKI